MASPEAMPRFVRYASAVGSFTTVERFTAPAVALAEGW
jgi:hypothetical protein